MSEPGPGPARARRRPRRQPAPELRRRPALARLGRQVGAPILLAVVLLADVLVPAAGAAFSAVTANSSNSLTSAATFPTYPATVTGQTPWFYHRLEDSPSSSATSTMTDTSPGTRPGVFNGPTNGPSLWWQFDEGSGTSAYDASGGAITGTLTNGPTWTTSGHPHTAASLDGVDDHVLGSGPAARTNAAFTVAAWVYSTNTGNRTILSQVGSQASAFDLRRDSGGKWAFAMTSADSASPTSYTSLSTGTATSSTWTHVVGVYNGSTATVYVNGSAGSAATVSSSWSATGAVQAGRALSAGSYGQYFGGRIDDVRVYGRALSAAEVLALSTENPLTEWTFDEGSGTTTADQSGYGNTGTLRNSATWSGSGHRSSAVSLSSGSNQYVDGGTAIATNTSFTVSAWVYLTSSGTSRDVVTVDGTNISGLYLYYYGSLNRWGFDMYDTDSTSSAFDRATSTSVPALNTWTHLVAVYDDPNDIMRLYVDGVQEATASHVNDWNATNGFVVGRGLWSGSGIQYWNGRIDDVRAYQQVLSAQEVDALYRGFEPTSPMGAGTRGALQGAQQGLGTSNAVAFQGIVGAYNNTSSTNPTTFTVMCWFKAAGTTGGQLIGFDTATTGDHTTNTSNDRVVYLDSSGKLRFGVYIGGGSPFKTIVSGSSYNDGAWHHVAASLGSAGMQLYVDGKLVASDANTAALNITGYWRLGGGYLGGWPSAPSNDYFRGTLDEVSVVQSQLSAQSVAKAYLANH